MLTLTTRRHLLGGSMLAASALAVPASAAPASSPAAESPELLALVEHARAVERAAAEHDRTIYEPAKARQQAAVAVAEAAHPHVTVDAGLNVASEPLIWSTAAPHHIAIAKSIVALARETGQTRPSLAAARKLCAADLWRARAIERARAAHDLSDIFDQADAIGTRGAAAQDNVMAFECQSAADLALKLACMVEWNEEGWGDTLLADARRLAQREG